MALEAGMAPAAGTALTLPGSGEGTSRGDRDGSRDGTGTSGVGMARAAGTTRAAGTALTPPGSGDRDGISIPRAGTAPAAGTGPRRSRRAAAFAAGTAG